MDHAPVFYLSRVSLLMTKICGNFIRAQQGVTSSTLTQTPAGGLTTGSQSEPLLLNNFRCEKNDLGCCDSGVDLSDQTYCLGRCAIAENTVTATNIAGISVSGFAFPQVDVSGTC